MDFAANVDLDVKDWVQKSILRILVVVHHPLDSDSHSGLEPDLGVARVVADQLVLGQGQNFEVRLEDLESASRAEFDLVFHLEHLVLHLDLVLHLVLVQLLPAAVHLLAPVPHIELVHQSGLEMKMPGTIQQWWRAPKAFWRAWGMEGCTDLLILSKLFKPGGSYL